MKSNDNLLFPKRIIRSLERSRENLRKYGVKRIGLFGSYLRMEGKERSDMDFLVVLQNPTFDNYMGLKFFLERLFRRKVDLVTERSLKPSLKYVMGEALYAKGI